MPVTPRATAPADTDLAIVDALPALLMGVDWNNVLDAGTRGVIERQALLPFLRRQRWMVPAAREIRQARFADWSPLRNGASPSFMAVVAVDYVDGSSESCLLPLALVDGDKADAARKQSPRCVVARITGAGRRDRRWVDRR
jgi:maltose alpha-D-glucosyltransferase/alpha-amylase